MTEDNKATVPHRSLNEIRDLMAKSREGIVPKVDVRYHEQYVLIQCQVDAAKESKDAYLTFEAAANLEFLANAFVSIGIEVFSKSPLALMDAMQLLKDRLQEGIL